MDPFHQIPITRSNQNIPNSGKMSQDKTQTPKSAPSQSDIATGKNLKHKRDGSNSNRHIIPSERLGKPSEVSSCNSKGEQTLLGSQTQKKDWSEKDERLLKRLIIDQHHYDWKFLAETLGFEVNEVKQRWQKHIYPKLTTNSKVGGALKWSPAQDRILLGYEQKYGFDFDNILPFLPVRTAFSLEGRWRRINKSESRQGARNYMAEEDTPEQEAHVDKHKRRKQVIRLIASMKKVQNMGGKPI